MNKVKQLREERDMTQAELSELSGIAQDRISRIESGKILTIQAKTKQRLAFALKVDASYFDEIDDGSLSDNHGIPTKIQIDQHKTAKETARNYLQNHNDSRLQYLFRLGFYAYFVPEDQTWYVYDSRKFQIHALEDDAFNDVMNIAENALIALIPTLIQQY